MVFKSYNFLCTFDANKDIVYDLGSFYGNFNGPHHIDLIRNYKIIKYYRVNKNKKFHTKKVEEIIPYLIELYE